MAFTQTDLDNANQALNDYAQGKRKVTVTWSDSGGTRTVQYDRTTIEQLIKVRDLIAAELKATATPPKTRSMFTRTVKGL